jgi:hypothetical protein
MWVSGFVKAQPGFSNPESPISNPFYLVALKLVQLVTGGGRWITPGILPFAPPGPRRFRVAFQIASAIWRTTPVVLNHLLQNHSHFCSWWREVDSNHRRRKPADLQSAPVGRLGIPPAFFPVSLQQPRILSSGRWITSGVLPSAPPGPRRLRVAFDGGHQTCKPTGRRSVEGFGSMRILTRSRAFSRSGPGVSTAKVVPSCPRMPSGDCASTRVAPDPAAAAPRGRYPLPQDAGPRFPGRACGAPP